MIDKRRARLQIMVAQQRFGSEFHVFFIRHVAIKIGQRQFHAPGGRLFGNRPANAFRRAGDHRDLALQFLHGKRPPLNQ